MEDTSHVIRSGVNAGRNIHENVVGLLAEASPSVEHVKSVIFGLQPKFNRVKPLQDLAASGIDIIAVANASFHNVPANLASIVAPAPAQNSDGSPAAAGSGGQWLGQVVVATYAASGIDDLAENRLGPLGVGVAQHVPSALFDTLRPSLEALRDELAPLVS